MHDSKEPHAIEVLQRRKNEIELELVDVYSSFSVRNEVLYNLQDELIKNETSLVYFMGRCKTS